MTIKVGDKMPKGQFTRFGANGPEPLSTDDLFKGKKVVLFSVPGAFTPTCSAKHLPGFVTNADAIKAFSMKEEVGGTEDAFPGLRSIPRHRAAAPGECIPTSDFTRPPIADH